MGVVGVDFFAQVFGGMGTKEYIQLRQSVSGQGGVEIDSHKQFMDRCGMV